MNNYYKRPIGLLIFQMDAHDAVPFSLTVVTGVMLFRVLTQIIKKERHSKKNQSIINQDIACLFAPSTCLGAQIGVMINRALPSWLILLCYVTAMAGNIYVTKKKYHKQVLNENNALAKKLIENKQEEMKIINQQKEQKEQKKQKDSNNFNLEEDKVMQRIEEIKQLDARNIKWDRILFIVLTLATMFIIDLLKGSATVPSIISITPCSSVWWLMQFAFIPFGLYYIYKIQFLFLKESQEKIDLQMEIDQNDLKYDNDLIIKISILGVLSGILAAILGIGGGIIVAPVLLSLGLEPSETSATTSFVILSTSLMNITKYMMIGSIIWDYAIFAGFAGCIGFYIGLKCIQFAIKNNKQSFIILALIGVSIFASILVIFIGVKKAINDYANDINIFTFHSICSK